MALKNLYDMVKADRYTADGREALIKAQEAETEDATRRTYQIGEISQTTGLQKTANGWKPPKETKFGKVTQNKEGQWGVQTKLGKGSGFIKHKDENEAKRALSNYTRGYNRTASTRPDPHSDQARQVKHWDKETEKIRKQNRAEGRTAHAEAAKKGNAERQDKIEKLKERAFNKTELEGLSKGKLDNLYKSEIESKPDGAEVHQQRGEEIKANLEAAKYYFNKAQSFSPTDPSYKTYMTKAKQYNDEAKAQADDNGFDFEEMHNSRITQAVEKFATGAQDAAPRVLTGDTRIRVRKA